MNKQKVLVRAIPALVAWAVAGYAHASAFALIEQSGSGMGNAFAGAAASAEDASTIYFNPAGLTALPAGKQVTFGLHAVEPSAKFRDSGTSQGAAGVSPVGGVQRFGNSGMGGDAGSLAFVPNVYFAMSLDPKWSVGVGINAPFGLKTEYDDMWIGRFQGIKSELKTVNINPTVAYKVSDQLSVGFGLDYQRIDAELTKAVNYQFIVASSGVPTVPGAIGVAAGVGNIEGRSRVKGDDTAWGFNLGLTYDLSDRTRLGIAYRSSVDYTLKGQLTVVRPVTASAIANAVIAGYANTKDQDVSVSLKTPDTASVSVVQKLDDKWDMLGDLSWTGWSKIQEIRINMTAAGATPDVTTWKLRDTLRLSLGANYRYADNMKFRFGVAYDQSPVPDQYRTVRLPDNDRTWLSVGMQYKPSKQSAFDVGFSYIFVKDTPINNFGEVAAVAPYGYPRGLINGSYDASVKILSAQYSYSF